MNAEYRGLVAVASSLVVALVACCTWVVAFPPLVPIHSYFPSSMVRLDGVHAEEVHRGVPFRWSGPRPRVLIRCLPLARPTAIRLAVQPEPGGRELNATAVIPGLSVTTFRTTTVTVPIPAGACARGTAVVQLRSRVVVLPGDSRVLGMQLSGGEVEYSFGIGSATVWGREVALLLLALALLTSGGVLQANLQDGWRLAAVGVGVTTLGCLAFWPLAAPVGASLLVTFVVGRTLRTILPDRTAAGRLLVMLVVVVFATLMVTHAVDLPRQDEWPEIIHRLRLAEHGQWDRMDWFAQSSQHRHAVPRVVLVAMALATSWSASAVAWVAVLAHIGCWLAVVWLMRGDLDDWALVALALVWFSPAQYESFVWGWALHGGLTLLFSVLALVATDARRGPTGVLLAMACCTLASYCTAPGLVSWIVCAGALIARRRWHASACLVPAGIACVATYFAGYVRPGDYAAIQFRIVDGAAASRTAIGVALGVFAQPLGLAPRGAAIAGISLLSLLVLRARRPIPAQGVALGVLGLAWWLATILGRFDGTPALLSISRYGWTVLPLWALLASTPGPRTLRATALAVCAIAGAQGWARGVVAVDGWRSAMETGRDAMLSGFAPVGTALYWSPESIPEMQEDLRRWRYSLYRDQSP